jgi:predicted dehydrogenase
MFMNYNTNYSSIKAAEELIMNKQVNIVLTGLNGYGENFVKELLRDGNGSYKLVAVVSGNPKKSQYYNTLIENGVKFYADLQACFEENEIDLAIITTPMHIHYKEVTCALNHNANVFCEKPLAPTIDECLEIEKLAEKNNLFVAVAFQWSYSNAIQNLKKDILDNKFGKIINMKTIVNWSRPKSYFEGSSWKGKNIDKDGNYILECLMSNATSHFLHNLLFLSSKELTKAAYPTSIEGEGYKANRIDGYDTVFMRINTDTNCQFLYLATIASKEQKEPSFKIEFEKASVFYDLKVADNIIVKTHDGKILEYGSPEEEKYNHWLSAVYAIRTGSKLACDVATILPEVITVNAAIENIPATAFESNMLEEDELGVWAKDITSILENCYDTEKLPSELGYEWATKAKKVEIIGYKSFSGIAKG